MHIPKTEGGGTEPPIAQVQIKGQPEVTSPDDLLQQMGPLPYKGKYWLSLGLPVVD